MKMGMACGVKQDEIDQTHNLCVWDGRKFRIRRIPVLADKLIIKRNITGSL
jgi:hypothetical protein